MAERDIRLQQLIIRRRMRIQFLNDDGDDDEESCVIPRFRELIGDFLARFQPVTRGEENKAKDLLAIGRK